MIKMSSIHIDIEKSWLCQCPKCKRIYIDKSKCKDCGCILDEITDIVTDAY